MNELFKWVAILGTLLYVIFLMDECRWMEEMWPEIEMDILFSTDY